MSGGATGRRDEGTVRPGDYDEQARTYDRTRGASPTVVRALLKHLGSPDGGTLLDIAGGTGTYAQVLEARGFRVTVVDAASAMLARSVPKLGRGRQVAGDAMALPFRDGTFGCATCIVAIHLFADRSAAFREARRVIREGPLVVVAYTRENLSTLFVHEYFGGQWPGGEGFSAAEVEDELHGAGFSRVEGETFVYTDTAGGSLVALHTDPYRLAGPAYLRNTSFWHRLDPQTRRAGLARLEADLRSGALQERVEASVQAATRTGHGTVFAATP